MSEQGDPMEVSFLDPSASLLDLTELDALRAKYQLKMARSSAKGIDRMTTDAFERQIDRHLQVIQGKVRSGSYRFSPYLEILISKGRDKSPRVVSAPTLRDKLVLIQLKDHLHGEMPTAVNRRLPNQYIREIREARDKGELNGLSFLKADIKSFYDTIRHEDLLATLKGRLSDPRALALVRNAIRTPTVTMGTHRTKGGRALNRLGVPQGLPIANILANAYLADFDAVLKAEAVLYFRYVDDILIFAKADRIEELRDLMELRLAELGLGLNPDKTKIGSVAENFEYLGYAFSLPTISVRRASYEGFLANIAALFAGYQYRLRNKGFPSGLADSTRRQAFVDEVNEKITGALSETRRYGWLFYFIEIDDDTLLHTMDGVVRSFFARLDDFGRAAPPGLKKLSRAYFEARFSPQSGYILNYNDFSSIASRLAFLISRLVIDLPEAKRLSADDVNRHFDEYKERQLQRLEMDVGLIS